LILNKINYIFAFCIKQTRNQDLSKPEIILFYDNIGEMPYMLRYSFASHHIENETDLIYIPEFTGHGNSKATEIYKNVSKKSFRKFKNPLDDII